MCKQGGEPLLLFCLVLVHATARQKSKLKDPNGETCELKHYDKSLETGVDTYNAGRLPAQIHTAAYIPTLVKTETNAVR